jgi:hypothetical protein
MFTDESRELFRWSRWSRFDRRRSRRGWEPEGEAGEEGFERERAEEERRNSWKLRRGEEVVGVVGVSSAFKVVWSPR